MRDSIFSAAIRSFFVALFGAIGLVLGLSLIFMLIGGLSSLGDNTPQLSYKYSPEVKPNTLNERKVLADTTPVILKINVKNVIGTEGLNHNSIRNQLVESRERSLKGNRVKAILLDINTPGGGAIDADAIYHELKAYKEAYKVPIYAYVDGLCASGGVYVAMAADKIYASDASLIGSVGVITPPFMNFSQLLEKIGVQSMTLYEGKGKDDMSSFRPWKPGEEDNLKAIIASYYNKFVDIVVQNRPELDKKKLVDVYGANIFPAQQAKEHGYIDVSGSSLNECLAALTEELGIADEDYQVIEMESKNFFKDLFSEKFSLLQGKVTHTFSIGAEYDPALSNQFLYLYRP